MWMNSLLSNIKIRTSLILVQAFFLIMLLAGAVLGIFSLHANNISLSKIVDNQRLSVLLYESIDDYKNVHATLGRAIISFAVNSDQQSYAVAEAWGGAAEGSALSAESRDLIAMARTDLKSSIAVFGKFRQLSADLKGDADTTAELGKRYDELIEKGVAPLLDLVEAGQLDELHLISGSVTRQLETQFYRALTAFQQQQKQAVDDLYGKEADQYALVLKLVGAAIVACLFIAGMAYAFLQRIVLRPLQLAGRHFDRIAAGDLSEGVEVHSNNEIGLLFAALQRMQDGLIHTVSEVRQGVSEIRLGSHEIFVGNTDLSGRTEQQAAALQQTAASIEQLASTVRQNTDNAAQANHVAQDASEVAGQGGQAVSQVVVTMQEISSGSRQMAEIVSVIDGIAFQTNILALNAAVEAARAGEQGKGFAVVAAEVRSLAQRSAQAAKEIKGLIESSQNKVQMGARQAAEAGDIMDKVVTSVREVTRIMGEIASASHEQSDGIQQVNRAVSEMDGVVQQNAALVEQAAAAAGSLQQQTSRLAEAVAVFRLRMAADDQPGVSETSEDSNSSLLSKSLPVLQIT